MEASDLLTPNRKVQPDLLVGCQHMTKEVCWRAAVRSVGRLPLLQNGRHGSVSFVDGETEQHGKERIGDVIGVTAGLWVASNRDSDRK